MDLEKNSPHCIGRKEIEPEGFKRTILCVKKQALFFSILQKLVIKKGNTACTYILS